MPSAAPPALSVSAPPPCVAFDGLSVAYRGRLALHGLSGTIRRGSLTAVVGPNGSGKTTLMQCIAGLLAPSAGRCAVAPGLRVAYQPQLSGLDRAFPARVADVVSLGLWPRRGLLGRHRRQDRAALQAALQTVGMADQAQRPIDSLSGGQLQRALFARTLLQDADLILLDEPFSAIDERTVQDLLAIIVRWHKEGRTVLVVVHDDALVRRHFPDTLLLAGGPIAWGDTASTLTPENVRRARHADHAGYGASTLQAVA